MHLGWGVKSKRRIEKWPGSTNVICVDDIVEYIAMTPLPAEQLVTGLEIQAESRHGSTKVLAGGCHACLKMNTFTTY